MQREREQEIGKNRYQYAQSACAVGGTTTVTVVVGWMVTVDVFTTVRVSVNPNCVKVNVDPS